MHIQRQELGDRVQDNVYDQRDLRCAGRNALGVEAYQHDREDRHGVEAEALLQEVIQTGRCIDNERRYADGYDRKTGAYALAYAYQMCIACSLVEQRPVKVQRVKRYTAVQCRVKGRQDRTEQNRCNDAEQPVRNNRGDQRRVCQVAVCQAVSEEAVSQQTADGDEERIQQLEECGEYSTSLCLCQILGSQRALDDGLVGAPVEQVVEQHAEEQNRPRNHRRQGVRRIDRVELLRRNIGDKVLNAGKEAAVAEDADGQDRDQQTADQQTHAVYGIGYRNCLQAAEDCVDGTDNADCNTQDCDALEAGDAEQLIQLEDLVEGQRTGVQYGRQVSKHVAEQEQERDDLLGGAVKSNLQKFRDSGDAGFQILRQEDQCQRQQRDTCVYRPAHGTHVGRVALSGLSDQLFGGQVGHFQ